jgi:hypothetical protein
VCNARHANSSELVSDWDDWKLRNCRCITTWVRGAESAHQVKGRQGLIDHLGLLQLLPNGTCANTSVPGLAGSDKTCHTIGGP